MYIYIYIYVYIYIYNTQQAIYTCLILFDVLDSADETKKNESAIRVRWTTTSSSSSIKLLHLNGKLVISTCLKSNNQHWITLNNHTKKMQDASVESVSNLQALSSKPNTKAAVGQHPRSRSLSDGSCIGPGGWATGIHQCPWIYGTIGTAKHGVLTPKYVWIFLACLSISIRPTRIEKRPCGPTMLTFTSMI